MSMNEWFVDFGSVSVTRSSVGRFVQAGVVGLNGMVDSFVGYTQHRLVSCAGFGSAFGIEP